VVRLAHARGVSTMALTDHDSTEGLAEAQQVGAELGVRVIPGIELSTDLPGVSIHVLGLFLNHTDSDFQQQVHAFRAARVTRAEQMVSRLSELGAPISLERVLEIAGEGSVGRPHVAQALLEAGHVQSIEEAFDRFIGRNGPAYFEGFRLEPAEAVRLIHQVGGFAAWAHPIELDGKPWRDYLPSMIAAGIDGLEVYYFRDYGPDMRAQLLDACATHDLLPTVGSDYHGFPSMNCLPGSVAAPSDLLDRIEARLRR
jgi:3',5'-nucleoside bisphosphate phosphatase